MRREPPRREWPPTWTIGCHMLNCMAGNAPGCSMELKQARTTFIDEKEKLRFRWALAWHPVTSSPSATSTTRPSGSTRQHMPPGKYNTTARPDTKACKTYNESSCNKGATHSAQQHICSHCLSAINHAFPHPKKDCNRKKGFNPKMLKRKDTRLQSVFPHYST